MKLPSLKVVILTPVVAFIIFYVFVAILLYFRDPPTVAPVSSASPPLEVAIFGASGTAGDGILQAAIESKDIKHINVITRRITPRMEAGVNDGKLTVSQHMDYLDYSSVLPQLSAVDAVYWAIGISSLGVDEETYGLIHVDFPRAFVKEWLGVSGKDEISFHFISSSDISEDSNTMWIREKIRAEKTLFELAADSKLRVIAYRPDYIAPTEAEAHLGQDMLYWFFKPVGAAVKARQIGQAMIDVSLREPRFENGSKLSTGKIVMHSNAYETIDRP
ncbi:MAG: hypothetical protein AAF431_16090 [Pseudomonadota bacterium]